MRSKQEQSEAGTLEMYMFLFFDKVEHKLKNNQLLFVKCMMPVYTNTYEMNIKAVIGED